MLDILKSLFDQCWVIFEHTLDVLVDEEFLHVVASVEKVTCSLSGTAPFHITHNRPEPLPVLLIVQYSHLLQLRPQSSIFKIIHHSIVILMNATHSLDPKFDINRREHTNVLDYRLPVLVIKIAHS